ATVGWAANQGHTGRTACPGIDPGGGRRAFRHLRRAVGPDRRLCVPGGELGLRLPGLPALPGPGPGVALAAVLRWGAHQIIPGPGVVRHRLRDDPRFEFTCPVRCLFRRTSATRGFRVRPRRPQATREM
ncbi:MAG: hypothetical protein, partial [Olavius algarvensis Gamma 1 endosymbiont]